MKFININSLNERFLEVHRQFNSTKPFRFAVVEQFFNPESAAQIHNAFPPITDGTWNRTTYIDQRNKAIKEHFKADSIFKDVFAEINSDEFIQWLVRLSGIPDLQADRELFGAGLHQSISGAHLNVHIDYNIHPITKYHRRLNVLVYMNEHWLDEYNGHLELWDLTTPEKKIIGKFAPTFNRCIIFETNEVSYHGHPKPLNIPQTLSRKSLAAYYYTKDRPINEIAKEHNTSFVNTEGIYGQIRRFRSGLVALIERVENLL
ncbi:MAG: 2OG-Fe(II) oxygenase [Chitinophagales bacterium]